MRGRFWIAAGFALACYASTQATAAMQKAEETSPQANAPKKICRSVEVIGSRLQKHKVCMTADEWRAMARNARDDVDQRTRAPHQEATGG